MEHKLKKLIEKNIREISPTNALKVELNKFDILRFISPNIDAREKVETDINYKDHVNEKLKEIHRSENRSLIRKTQSKRHRHT